MRKDKEGKVRGRYDQNTMTTCIDLSKSIKYYLKTYSDIEMRQGQETSQNRSLGIDDIEKSFQ